MTLYAGMVGELSTRKSKSLVKRANRARLNSFAKQQAAKTRQANLVELGRSLVKTEVDGVVRYDLPESGQVVAPPSIPRLSWLGAKMRPQGDPRKSRSGHRPEHVSALTDNVEREHAAKVLEELQAHGVDTSKLAENPPTDPAGIE